MNDWNSSLMFWFFFLVTCLTQLPSCSQDVRLSNTNTKLWYIFPGYILNNHDKQPIANARIRILDREKVIYSWKSGEYWRLLLAGKYEMEVSATGYVAQTVNITINNSPVLRKDFFLQKDPGYNNAAERIKNLNLIFMLVFIFIINKIFVS